MEDFSLSLIIRFLLGFICFYIYDQFLFFSTQKKYCKKNNGNCKNCNCWSCPRFQFLDKEGNLKDKIENKIHFDLIKSKIKKLFNINKNLEGS